MGVLSGGGAKMRNADEKMRYDLKATAPFALGCLSTIRHCALRPLTPPFSMPSKFGKFPLWFIVQAHPSNRRILRS